MGTCCEIGPRWMPQNLTSENSTLVVGRQQAITWANIDADLCHHMASPEHDELTPTANVKLLMSSWWL